MEKPKLSTPNQEYRDDLAKELKETRKKDEDSSKFIVGIKKAFGKDGRSKAEKLLEKEKGTDEYKKAEKEQKEVREDLLKIKSWEELIEKVGVPSNEDLRYIIKNVQILKEEAGKKLLEHNPSNKDLEFIIKELKSLREEAGKKLLEQNPSNKDLEFIIEELKSLREEAGKKLLEQNPSNEDLEFIVENIESLREEAGKKILEQNPSNKDLEFIIYFVESLREEAGKKLLEQNPDNSNLIRIIKKVESLREEAGKRLLEENPSSGELMCIVRNVESLQERAGKKFLLLKTSYFDASSLEFILKNINSLSKEVAQHIEDNYGKFTQHNDRYMAIDNIYWSDDNFKIRDFIHHNIQMFNDEGAEILFKKRGAKDVREYAYKYVFSNDDLFDIIIKQKDKCRDSLRKEAGKEILKRYSFDGDLQRRDLQRIIIYVEPLREEVARRLLAENPSNSNLVVIIENVESLREEAGKKLLEQNPSNEDLEFIVENIESLREEADKIKRGADIMKRIK